jgi:hypothetical protein
MTILEARELALAGKTVMSPTGYVCTPEQFLSIDAFITNDVFGEWREKREPRRVYALEENGQLICAGLVADFGEMNPGERIVEFVEQL